MPLPGRRVGRLGVTFLSAVAVATWSGLLGPSAGRAFAGTAPGAGGTTVSAAAVGAPSGDDPVAPILSARPPSVRAAMVAGTVVTFGRATNEGSLAGIDLAAPVVGMAATPDGRGYWLVASDGGVFSFGDARFYGSTGKVHLSQPVVGMAATPDGHGYWLVASDGGIFSFGDAHFYGSTGKVHLSQPVVGMAATPDGHGYWLVASDGGIFSFGDAHFYGSAAGRNVAQPIVDMVAAPGGGYWLAEGLKSTSGRNPFTSSVVDALEDRSGTVSAAVLDLNTGQEYLFRPAQEGIAASIVKVQILGTLLSQAQAQNRSLTPTEQSLARAMITQSDNAAATSLWDEVGGVPAVSAFDAFVGMASTTPNAAWGLTTTTAADQVTLLDALVADHRVLTAASGAYELDLMGSVEPDQAWGVSAGVGVGATVDLKNGWLPTGDSWTVNSIGRVNGDGRNYLIAVLTDNDPGEGYGIDSVSMISEAAWAALDD